MYFNAPSAKNGYAKKTEFTARVAKEFTVKSTHYQNAKSEAYLFAKAYLFAMTAS
jgi:hypothetical protein